MMHAPDGLPESSAGAAIACQGVVKRYRSGARHVDALRGVDLTVAHGSWLAIMGASGSGKSTLLQLLGGLDTPDDGTIAVAGQPIEHLSEAARAILRRRHIGYVFQFFNLVSNLSVSENVALPMVLVGAKRAAIDRRCRELLDALGIGDLAAAAPGELSGGQQQRVALARALVNRPDVLLADEPTGNLDSAATADVLALLGEAHGLGQTIVMVTHDAAVAAAADRVVTKEDGRIVGDRASDRPLVGAT